MRLFKHCLIRILLQEWTGGRGGGRNTTGIKWVGKLREVGGPCLAYTPSPYKTSSIYNNAYNIFFL